jgi:hypothetical protein
VNGGVEWSMFMPPVLLGLSHDYSNLSKWLDENLVPEHAAEFRKAEKQCFSSNYEYEKRNMNMYFKRGVSSLLDPVPLSVFNSAGMLCSLQELLDVR